MTARLMNNARRPLSDRFPERSPIGELRRVFGTLRRDARFESVYEDLRLLREYDDLAFLGWPVDSACMRYEAWVVVTDRKVRGTLTVCEVVRCKWKPCAPATSALDERLCVLSRKLKRLCQAPDWKSNAPFDVKTVLKLDDAQIAKAFWMWNNDRFRLLFGGAHDLNLPDLDPLQMFGTMTPWQNNAISVYEMLKLDVETGHSVTSLDRLGVTQEALAWLLENDVVRGCCADWECVSLSHVDEWEACLVESYLRLRARSDRIHADPYEVRTEAGHTLCDEQLLAFGVHLEKPVLLVDGLPGSGKTDFLAALAQISGRKILATSFMGVNVGPLNRMFDVALTTHKLLGTHADHDHSRGKCFFQEASLLVVEEVGTESLEMLSKLFSACATCATGAFKVVMVGDSGQLPPIAAASPLRALIETFRDTGELAIFEHNHRVKEGARLLADNTRAIRDGRIDDVAWDEDNFVRVPPSLGLAHLYRKFALKEDEHVVMTLTNELRKRLNVEIKAHYGDAGRNGIEVGRKFSFTRNKYDGNPDAINNEILVLDAIVDVTAGGSSKFWPARPLPILGTRSRKTRNGPRLVFARDMAGRQRQIEWNSWCNSNVDDKSAATVNATQGSQFRFGVVVMERPSRHWTKERLVTAMTRATDGFFFVGEEEWFRGAAANPEPEMRSRLVERFREAAVPLEILNRHPRDALLEYDERTHSYAGNGTRCDSVTRYLSTLFPKFDANAVSKNSCGKGKYVGMTQQEVAAKWKADGEEAARAGTELHNVISKYYEMRNAFLEDPAWELFLLFDRERCDRGWIPHRTEWRIFDEEMRLGGTLDALFRLKDGTFALVDWKRCKKIDKDSKWGNGTGEPSRDLPHCNYWRYGLQLACYALILSRNYDVSISEAYIAAFRAEAGAWELHEVPLDAERAKRILEDRREKKRKRG